MKKTIGFALLFFVFLAAYLSWPPASLYGLAVAVQARDVAGVSQRIDLPEIRRSLAVQVVAAYLDMTGKKTNSFLGQMMLGGATTIADALLAKLVTPDALIDLIGRGDMHSASPSLASNALVLSPAIFNNLWGVLANSDYAIVRYHVRVPFDRPAADQFRLQLQLSGGTWRLIEVELPQQLRRQLAQSIIDSQMPRNGEDQHP